MESELYVVVALQAPVGRQSGYMLTKLGAKSITLPIMHEIRLSAYTPVYMTVRDGRLYALQAITSNVILYEIKGSEFERVDAIGTTVHWPHIYTNRWPIYHDSDNLAIEYKTGGGRTTYIATVDWSGNRPRLVTLHSRAGASVRFMQYVNDLSRPGKRYELYCRTEYVAGQDTTEIGDDYIILQVKLPHSINRMYIESPGISVYYTCIVNGVLHVGIGTGIFTVDMTTNVISMQKHQFDAIGESDAPEFLLCAIMYERLVVHFLAMQSQQLECKLTIIDSITGDKYNLDTFMHSRLAHPCTLIRAPITWMEK